MSERCPIEHNDANITTTLISLWLSAISYQLALALVWSHGSTAIVSVKLCVVNCSFDWFYYYYYYWRYHHYKYPIHKIAA